MDKKMMRWIALGLCLAAAPLARAAAGAAAGPVALQVDNLRTPLGIDDARPRFSWQLSDAGRGAKQTAYCVQVASRPELLSGATAKPDVWDSGKIESGESLNVGYGGPALKASTRYFWRVTVWGAEGKPYAASAASWWETGLLKQEGWRAGWIGYETAEEAAVRNAPAVWIANPDAKALAAEKADEQHFAFRKTVTLSKPVRRAALYATGQETVSAWINGERVLSASELPPYKQLPWKKFMRAEATGKLKAGANTIAIEAVHYVANPNGMAIEAAPAVIATLYVEYTDGTSGVFVSGLDWKSAIHAAAGWQAAGFADAEWKSAVEGTQAPGATMGQPLGHPWIPDSVKALRHEFKVTSAVKSARLYATALGAYELFLNGRRVGDALLAPGWTDYRQHVKYQTYDVTAQVASGNNVVAALLAPGWYATPLEWYQQPNNYGDTPPALWAQLRIEHADGSVEWVQTDASWLAKTSYIEHAEIYDGESQDERLAHSGWAVAGISGAGWKPVLVIEPKPIAIEAQDYPAQHPHLIHMRMAKDAQPHHVRILHQQVGQLVLRQKQHRVSAIAHIAEAHQRRVRIDPRRNVAHHPHPLASRPRLRQLLPHPRQLSGPRAVVRLARATAILRRQKKVVQRNQPRALHRFRHRNAVVATRAKLARHRLLPGRRQTLGQNGPSLPQKLAPGV